MKLLISFVFVLITTSGNAQFEEFELVDAIQSKQGNYIVYITATWCKPCMAVLPEIVDSFSKLPNHKLIVWFERTYLAGSAKITNQLRADYDDSILYLVPQRYYQYEGRLKSIFAADKAFKQITEEVNATTLLNIQWKDRPLIWGTLLHLSKGDLFIAKDTDKRKTIRLILNKVTSIK